MKTVSDEDLESLILQYLKQNQPKFKETLDKFEQESGSRFNMNYFEEKILAGDWDEVERYLSAFTQLDANDFSEGIYYVIRRQKYLEALDKEHENFCGHGDTKAARSVMMIPLKKLIEANPVFLGKLEFPVLEKSRLRVSINQSLNVQPSECKHPKKAPGDLTLYTDHTCDAAPPTTSVPRPVAPMPLPAAATAPHANALAVRMANPAASSICPPVVCVHALGAPTVENQGQRLQPFPPAATAPRAFALAGRTVNATTSSIRQPAVIAALPAPTLAKQGQHLQPFPPAATARKVISSVSSIANATASSVDRANQVSRLKRPRSPSPGRSMKCSPSPGQVLTYESHPHSQPQGSLVDIPGIPIRSGSVGSGVTSLDFHPSQETFLLVGLGNGEINLWEIFTKMRLALESFKIWNTESCSALCQDSVSKDPGVSVSRVAWSPAGNVIGVAFNKHLIHLFGFHGVHDLGQQLEIESHIGGVNDLAFAQLNEHILIVSCGDDKHVKVWDLAGQKLYSFDGHDAPVYSVYPYQKGNIQLIYSTTTNGKIKAWPYDSLGSGVTYDAPGNSCTKLMYSADGTRLFSCGTNDEGDSFVVELNETDKAIKRTYAGFKKKSAGVMQFDTSKNLFVAAGEDHRVKFWNMNNSNLLWCTQADGGLPSLPRLRFSKNGNFLAVSTVDGFKILANLAGLRCLDDLDCRLTERTGIQIPEPFTGVDIKPAISKVEWSDESSRPRPYPVSIGVDTPADEGTELAKILVPSKCRVITLPNSIDYVSKVARLLYTNSGHGILVMGSNGTQGIWKWNRDEGNPTGKATASVIPQHWQPSSGRHMTNDVSDNLEDAVPCIALSKNDKCVMSACGGKISFINLMTFKVMKRIMPPPPAPTFLVLHPQRNNVVAIGMKDSTIHIYDALVDKAQRVLIGHQGKITGLAFSVKLNVLVSSGADAQLCTWNIDTWEKQKAITIYVPAGIAAAGDTRVQFHSDQIHLLVSNGTLLLIYNASTMECIHLWVRQVPPVPIAYATFSCDSQLIYAAYRDGNIGVLDYKSLRIRCCIAPSAYMSEEVLDSPNVRPVVIAAHPQEPYQLAVGLTDGTVKVLEPGESDGEWLCQSTNSRA